MEEKQTKLQTKEQSASTKNGAENKRKTFAADRRENELLNNRIGHLQVILCFLVMFVHFRNQDIFPTDPVSFVIFLQDTEVNMFGTTAVAGFFLISGYRFAGKLSMKTLGGKLKKRVFSLLIPYLVWNLIYSLYAFIMAAHPFLNRFADAKEVSVPEVLFGILDSARFNPVFWYMKFLMIMIPAASLIFAVFRKKAAFAAVLPLILCAGIAGSLIPGFPGWLYTFLLWSVFFFLGILLGHFGEKETLIGHVGRLFDVLSGALQKNGFVPFLISVLLYIPFYALYSFSKAPLSFLGYHLSYIFLLWSIAGFWQEKKPSFLASLTFFLYASHWLIARNLNKLFCVTFNTTQMLHGFFCYLMLPFAVVLIAFVCSRLGKMKIFRPLWNILSGGR